MESPACISEDVRLASNTSERYTCRCAIPVVLTDEVKNKLRRLPLALRREIGHKLFLIEEDLEGDVKKLQGSRNEYRLRVRDYRVLFDLEGRTVTVYAVGNRKDIYR